METDRLGPPATLSRPAQTVPQGVRRPVQPPAGRTRCPAPATDAGQTDPGRRPGTVRHRHADPGQQRPARTDAGAGSPALPAPRTAPAETARPVAATGTHPSGRLAEASAMAKTR